MQDARGELCADGLPARLQEEIFCDEFHLVDLRVYDNCKKVVTGCDHVFNLAADMGGKCPFHCWY